MKRSIRSLSLCAALVLSLGSTIATAGDEKHITLIQLSDVHGHIHPHAEIFPDGRMDPHAGGLAKLTTLINEVRADNPNNLLLALGDTTHGSAEMLFSLGDLIMPWLNSLDIDAFTPGNWDFGYGPRVYRQRFTPAMPPLAPNNRTTIAWMDEQLGNTCNVPGGLNATTGAECHVTKANFQTVAMNVYNFNEVAEINNPGQPLGNPVHLHDGKTYLIKEVGDVRVAILGLTTDVVPQQAQAFNTGFRFTMGYKEMPQQIAAAKADGADIIVVLSELGLAKNTQMVREFPEIDVMFSGHTHERTPEAIVIRHSNEVGDFSLVTEAGEDSFLGRLDLTVNGAGKIIDYKWDLMEADHTVAEDEDVAEMVEEAQSTFVEGPDHQCHTFGVNAFPFGTGHTLCDPIDMVIGYSEVTTQRFNVLEDISNNVMVDGFLDLALYLGTMGENDSKGNQLTTANTLSTTNGFRFDVVIFGDGEELADGSTANGDITIGDLYDYYPIGAATGLAEYTGGRIKTHWEGILDNVFDPNQFRQRGGWFLGYTHNMHFDLRLSDDFPRSISYGAKRIAKVTIDGQRVDESKIYTLASCYPHGNPVDEVCRTTGATNLRFIAANQEADCGGYVPATFNGPGGTTIESCQLDMAGPFSILPPVNDENIFDPIRFAGGGPLFLKVAPNDFVHPVDALRRYLPVNDVTVADHGLGRVNAIDPVPVSEYGGPGIVQPTQGAGAQWLDRDFGQED
ncbi:MAG: metallophosphoesterase [Gammaproteobacteria bacterium]|nr:MAG: metallophosphoesterase [Gammaproteobacteria bacterium]